MPITTCFSCVLFLCRLIAYEAVNHVLAFIFILCTILICPSQAWEAGPCRQTFSLSCNSPLPTPLLHKQSPIPPIKIHSKANQNQSTFFESGQGGSLLAAVFWMSRHAGFGERCVKSKKQLQGRLAGR